MANVSKRTIDYYTSIGLLQARRSKSNYRIYETETLDDLKFIEECKKLSLPLDTIRKKLDMKKCHAVDEKIIQQQLDYIFYQIKQLNNEVSDLTSAIQQFNKIQKETVSRQLLIESLCLLQSINLLTK